MNTQVNASAVTAGPNVPINRDLDSRDDLQVGPDDTVENVVQVPGLDSDSFGEPDETLVAHGGAEIADETTSDVVNDSAAVDLGSTGIGHLVTSPFTGDYNHQYRDSAQVAEEVRMIIANYVPYSIHHGTWNQIADFVRVTVRNVNPSNQEEARQYLQVTTKFVSWAVDTAGLDVDAALFHTLLIERFAAHYSGRKGANLRRTEQRLRRVAAAVSAEGLLPSASRGEPPLAQPYTRAESAQQNSWAISHPHEWRRRDSAFILCLGRGAGLESFEMRALTADDVTYNGAHTVLTVGGRNARTIPVFDDQAELLRNAMSFYKVSGYVLSKFGRSAPELMMGYTDRPALGKPRTKRLRSTWIVRHLNARAPLPEFLAAAGLTSTSTLNRYLPYVTATPTALELLTGIEAAK